jgi:hypothetical protein
LFAAIEGLLNSIRRPTLEHVASCVGNVALGDFVRLAQATVISPGDGDGPQGSKGSKGSKGQQDRLTYGRTKESLLFKSVEK